MILRSSKKRPTNSNKPPNLENTGSDSSSDLSEEEHQRQAVLIEKVKILCQMAEVHLDDLDDEYESNTLRSRLEKAKSIASEIDEEFYNNSALHFIIILAHKAGWQQEVKDLLDQVTVDFIKEKIIEEIGDEHT